MRYITEKICLICEEIFESKEVNQEEFEKRIEEHCVLDVIGQESFLTIYKVCDKCQTKHKVH